MRDPERLKSPSFGSVGETAAAGESDEEEVEAAESRLPRDNMIVLVSL